ncbi:cytochrome c oxidase subunit NDUFA4-like [Argonauta hians]
MSKYMKGLTMQSLKTHPSLIPLYVFVGAGMVGAAFYVTRLATRSLDVSWSRTTEQPWNQVDVTHQYKFYSPNIKYSELKAPEGRPDL